MYKGKNFIIPILLVVSFLSTSSKLQAQPYLYKMQNNEWGDQIFRINVQNGTKELFMPDTLPRYSSLSTDPAQTWLYVSSRSGGFLVINIAQPSLRAELPKDDVIIAGNRKIRYYPQLNKFVTSWERKYEDEGPVRYAVYDAATFALLDTVPIIENLPGYRVLSNDGSTFLSSYEDTITGNVYDQVLLTTTKKVIKQRRIATIGPPVDKKHVFEIRNDKVLYGCLYPTKNSSDGQYVIYDPRQDIVYPIIHDGRITEPHLSTDAKYLIWEDTPINPNSDPYAPPHIHTGHIFIYRVALGSLVSTQILPPNGQLMIFDTIKDTVYYYYKDTQRATSIDLKKIITFSSLREDFAASYKLNLLGSEKFFNELNKDLDKVEKELSKKDSAEAREKLEEFWKEIEEVRKEMVEEGEKDKDKEKEKFITEEAFNILKEDVTLLLAKLPQRENHKNDK